MKKAYMLLVGFLLLTVILIGCTTQGFTKPEQIPKAIEWISSSTEKAIYNKDLKATRLLWSQISEYGVKASEMGYQKLGEDLGTLASTYVNLVNYLETDDEKQLTIFRESFSEAIAELKESTPTEEE